MKGVVAKLTDFSVKIAASSSNHANMSPLGTIGSSVYSAPEMHKSFDPSFATLAAIDIWACGVTLFVMSAGFIPWNCASITDDAYRRFLNCPESFFPKHFSPNLKKLISKMLNPCPLSRINLKDCSSHQWIVDSYRQSFSNLNRFMSLTTSPERAASPSSSSLLSSSSSITSTKGTVIKSAKLRAKGKLVQFSTSPISVSVISISSLKRGVNDRKRYFALCPSKKIENSSASVLVPKRRRCLSLG